MLLLFVIYIYSIYIFAIVISYIGINISLFIEGITIVLRINPAHDQIIIYSTAGLYMQYNYTGYYPQLLLFYS
jgi:hypothetical protein